MPLSLRDAYAKAGARSLTLDDIVDVLFESEGHGGSSHVKATGHALQHVRRLDQPIQSSALSAGAKDFVVKPFQPSRVLEAVQRVLG